MMLWHPGHPPAISIGGVHPIKIIVYTYKYGVGIQMKELAQCNQPIQKSQPATDNNTTPSVVWTTCLYIIQVVEKERRTKQFFNEAC